MVGKPVEIQIPNEVLHDHTTASCYTEREDELNATVAVSQHFIADKFQDAKYMFHRTYNRTTTNFVTIVRAPRERWHLTDVSVNNDLHQTQRKERSVQVRKDNGTRMKKSERSKMENSARGIKNI